MNKNDQLIKMDVSMPAKDYKLDGYFWNSKLNREQAIGHYVHHLRCLVDGDAVGAENHKEEIRDIFSLDLCQNAVSLARSKGVRSKVFAVKEKQEPVFKVKGRKFGWILKDFRISKHPVPEKFKSVVRDVRNAGIEFDNFFIAEPDPATLPRRERDPVLLGVIGRWLVELGRWE